MCEERKPRGDLRPPSIVRMRRIGQGQVIYLTCIRQNRFSEVRIVEGSEAEPGHKKRPNQVDWAFILPAWLLMTARSELLHVNQFHEMTGRLQIFQFHDLHHNGWAVHRVPP